MKVKTSGQALAKQFSIVNKLASPLTGYINFKCDGKNLYLYSSNDVATYKSIIPCDSVDGEAEFSVAYDSLKTALGKRDTVTLSYINNTLVITSGSYKAELPTSDFISMVEPDKLTDYKEWEMDSDQNKWLISACSEVSLSNVDALSPFMPLTIRMNDKGTFIACYDNNRMSFIRTAKVKGNLDVVMPCDILLSVFSAFSGMQYKMRVTDSSLVIKSKLATVTLSLPTSDSYIDIKKLIELSTNVLKSNTSDMVISYNDLNDFMNSCRAVSAKERSELKVETKGKKMKLTVKTMNGAINQILDMQKPVTASFSLDMLYFAEAVGKTVSDELTIKLIQDTSIVVGSKNGWTVISLF